MSFGVARRAGRPPPEALAVKLWLTDEAAAYSACRDRAAGYLRRALTPAGFDVEVSYGGRPLRFEAADRRIERTVWPRRVLASVAGTGGIDPVRDVNLLVTDGTVSGPTVGYAYDHVATVPGARFLAASPPADTAPAVVDYSAPTAVAQLLVHEVGHALGLDHDHGSVDVDETAVTASPMVSGYAWGANGVRAEFLQGSGGTATRPPVGDRSRRLSMQFSASAERALRSYRGGLPV